MKPNIWSTKENKILLHKYNWENTCKNIIYGKSKLIKPTGNNR
jgi:hypothetical protein